METWLGHVFKLDRDKIGVEIIEYLHVEARKVVKVYGLALQIGMKICELIFHFRSFDRKSEKKVRKNLKGQNFPTQTSAKAGPTPQQG